MQLPTRDARPPSAEAEALAIAALTFLAAEPTRLGPFLAETGLGPENIRHAAHTPGFLPAVLDYLLSNESALLDFASHQGLDPAAIVAARNAIGEAPAKPK
jgi:hypothetical protein